MEHFRADVRHEEEQQRRHPWLRRLHLHVSKPAEWFRMWRETQLVNYIQVRRHMVEGYELDPDFR